ncbi:MAG: hypothetical protein IAE63_00995 [Alphaproteobacteria bacterium]|nr:hypothetical protein [Alphaproteobacteria bacterium]
MSIEDNKIIQTPPHVMSTKERLDEVAMYMARAVGRLKKKKESQGFKASLRQYLKAAQKRKIREKKKT